MDPIVRQAFNEMFKRFKDLDARSADRWQRLDCRLGDAAASIQEREQVVNGRLDALEESASQQYTAAIVADNWGPLRGARVPAREPHGRS